MPPGWGSAAPADVTGGQAKRQPRARKIQAWNNAQSNAKNGTRLDWEGMQEAATARGLVAMARICNAASRPKPGCVTR